MIQKYVSADGAETREVTEEGSRQQTAQVEEGDAVSRVIKRTVLHSEEDQKEVSGDLRASSLLMTSAA